MENQTEKKEEQNTWESNEYLYYVDYESIQMPILSLYERDDNYVIQNHNLQVDN